LVPETGIVWFTKSETMLPQSIQYTGLSLNPREMIWSRVVEGPYPAHWARIVVRVEGFNQRPLTQWTLENTNGRFGLIQQFPKIVLYFEDTNDAILFRLKDGQEAYLDGASPSF
jgi:hypothetical protein